MFCKKEKEFQPSPDKCPVCESHPSHGQTFLFVMNYQSEDGKFSLYQCPVCAVQFWLPFKNPGAHWYEKYEGYDHVFLAKPKIRGGYHKKVLKVLEKQDVKAKKFLDVGCGTGEFLSVLEQRKAHVFGIDFSPVFITIAKTNFGLKNLFVSPFLEFFQQKNLPRFDYITFFEVIEHVDNPHDLIRQARRFLKPEGMMIMSVPCRERMLVNWIKGEFPVNHLSRWNEKSLRYVLHKNGFKIEKIYYTDSFRFIYDALMNKTRFGLLRKIKKQFVLPEKKKDKKSFINGFLILLLYFFNSFRKAIFFNFALILFIFGKISKRKNGDILCFASLRRSS